MENTNQAKRDAKVHNNFNKRRKFYLLQWENEPAFEIVHVSSIKDKHVELHTGKIVNIEVLLEGEEKIMLQRGKIVSSSDDKKYLENIKRSMEEDFVMKQERVNQSATKTPKRNRSKKFDMRSNSNIPQPSTLLSSGSSTKAPTNIKLDRSKTPEKKTHEERIRETVRSIQIADTFVKKTPQILGLLSTLKKQYDKVNSSLQNYMDDIDKTDSDDACDTSDSTSDDASDVTSDDDASNDTAESASGVASNSTSGDVSDAPSESAVQHSTDNNCDSHSCCSTSPQSQNEIASHNDMRDSTTPDLKPEKIVLNAEGEEMVIIGPGGTLVPKYIMDHVEWVSHTMATRKLMMTLFPRRTLATHSLTGKSSPAFTNKPAKRCLDQVKVNDIVSIVARRSNVKESLVRSAITTKCADENKMFRMRQSRNAKRRNLLAQNKNNQENIPPVAEN